MAVYQRRRQATAALPAALAASAALHAVALFGVPDFDLSPRQSPPRELPLEVRVVTVKPGPPVPATAALPPQAARQVHHRALPRATPQAPAAPAAAVSDAPATAPPVASAPASAPPLPVTPSPSLASVPLASPPAPSAPALSPPAGAGAAGAVVPDIPAPAGLAPAEAEAEATPGPDEAAPAAAARYPFSEVRLEFDLLYGASPLRLGSVTHVLRIEDGHYAIEEVGEGRGWLGGLYQKVIGGRLVQRSAGTIGPDGFVPDEYFAQRGRVDRRERATFNWSEGTVVLSSGSGERKLVLAPGTQDLVSMLHQLFFMQPLTGQGTLTVATGRKLAAYAFEVVGRERVETGAGPVDAVHVRRLDPDGDLVELWLDAGHDMLPVRIYSAYRDGLVLDFVLRGSATVTAK